MGKWRSRWPRDLEAHPNASNAVLPVEVLSVFEPADGGRGVACSWTAELDGVPSRHCVQFLLHALGVCPVGRWRRREDSLPPGRHLFPHRSLLRDQLGGRGTSP